MTLAALARWIARFMLIGMVIGLFAGVTGEVINTLRAAFVVKEDLE